MVASDELPIASFMNATMVLPHATKGAPVKLIYSDSVFGIRCACGIVGWSKRPNAAQLYFDYLMSRAGKGFEKSYWCQYYLFYINNIDDI